MAGLLRATGGWGRPGIRQVCRILSASSSGGDNGSMMRGAIPYANSCRVELGRWVRCNAGVSPDLSN